MGMLVLVILLVFHGGSGYYHGTGGFFKPFDMSFY